MTEEPNIEAIRLAGTVRAVADQRDRLKDELIRMYQRSGMEYAEANQVATYVAEGQL